MASPARLSPVLQALLGFALRPLHLPLTDQSILFPTTTLTTSLHLFQTTSMRPPPCVHGAGEETPMIPLNQSANYWDGVEWEEYTPAECQEMDLFETNFQISMMQVNTDTPSAPVLPLARPVLSIPDPLPFPSPGTRAGFQCPNCLGHWSLAPPWGSGTKNGVCPGM